jgi:hypothetical protein
MVRGNGESCDNQENEQDFSRGNNVYHAAIAVRWMRARGAT